jgi:hypothetical protein
MISLLYTESFNLCRQEITALFVFMTIESLRRVLSIVYDNREFA